ncbi:MAG: recombinase family protein [Lachnospiraceae bacterium]|nr:recombinase family protein [Lachnospiraceae bacterium]
MARKSRKVTMTVSDQASGAQKVYRTAIYVRLSYEDERKIQQETVENQVAFLKAFVEAESELSLYDKYVDRGETGTSFNRPEFNRMINDMKAGKLDCIVVKDLSRLGRNYLETGDYIEKIFPFFGVRFIAVTDDYDSLTAEPSEDGLIVPLKNLINEAYAKDISKKIRSSIDNMYRDGIMVASSIAYGYLKDPDGDHQIMIDEVAAPIIRRIFDEYIGGKGFCTIARELNAEGISCPGERRFETGHRKKRKYEKSRWQGRTITYILTNPIYTGDLEMGKLKTDLCKGIKAEVQKKEDRVVVKDHHEAIITHETFEKARKIYELKRNQYIEARARSGVKRNNREFLLAGVLFCGDCKRRMTTHRRTYQNKSSVTYRGYYVCTRSTSYGSEDRRKDTIADVLEDTVAVLIRRHIEVFMDVAGRMKAVNKTSEASNRRKEFRKKERTLLKRKERIANVLQGLYSDYADGVFSESEYLEVKKSYIIEVEEIEEALGQLKAEEETWHREYEGDSEMCNTFHKYEGFEKLTKEIVNAFIKRIYYYGVGRMEVEYVFDDGLSTLTAILEGRGA